MMMCGERVAGDRVLVGSVAFFSVFPFLFYTVTISYPQFFIPVFEQAMPFVSTDFAKQLHQVEYDHRYDVCCEV